MNLTGSAARISGVKVSVGISDTGRDFRLGASLRSLFAPSRDVAYADLVKDHHSMNAIVTSPLEA